MNFKATGTEENYLQKTITKERRKKKLRKFCQELRLKRVKMCRMYLYGVFIKIL